MLSILEYLDATGRSPFRDWFDELGATAAARVAVALARMEQGNLSNAKGVARACSSTGSTSAPVTGCTSGATAARW